MIALLLSVTVFAGLAALVVRWARLDYEQNGSLSTRSAVSSWLLYAFHADSVATAAWVGAVPIGVPAAAAQVVGGAIAVAGFVLFIAATRQLVRDGAFSGARSERLVTRGLYGRSRHPQNLGWGMMLLGIAIAGRSLVALALVGVFAIFVERYATIEEHDLVARFGAEYERYRAGTRRLLGRSRQVA